MYIKKSEMKKIKKKEIKKKEMQRKILIALFALICVIACTAFILTYYIKSHLETKADLKIYKNAMADNITTFYYNDGKEEKEIEGSEIYSSQRHIYASIEQMPKNLINAFVAIEDKRFYNHKGVDLFRTVSAGANYVLKFKNSYGASTITQQLVKNVTGKDEYKIERKLQEILYALSLEKNLSKAEILEIYLNVINLSSGCKGVQAAAITYFSKDVSMLNLEECACIAAITNSPSYYNPYYNPENNKKRRQLILDEMFAQGYISAEEYERSYNAEITLKMNDNYKSEKINSWYIDMVIEDVISDLCKKYGYTESASSKMVYEGGLKIYTAMNPKIQRIMEAYYNDNSHFKDSEAGVKAQSSMIIINPRNGDILGVVGGRGVKTGNRVQNYATQTLRPSGSVIKPLSIYAPALENNLITYASVFDDVPVTFGKYNLDADKGEIVKPKPWPNNAPTIYHGLVNVNYALEISLNTVPVKILKSLTKEKSFDFLKNTLCMENLIEVLNLENGTVLTDKGVASLALGQMNYGLTSREVAMGYTIFANEGNYCKPRSYYSVEDAFGNILLENKKEEKRAISFDNATIMNYMLQNVVKNGTAQGISLAKLTEVAGKTGTSQDYNDRWFIGYTPEYIGSVWYGYEYPKPLSKDTKHICTEIWDDVMNEIYKGLNGNYEKKFKVSDNVIEVEYCMDSGKLATKACKMDPRGHRIEKGYFVKGTEPREYCDRHVLALYDRLCGGISEGFCPGFNTQLVGLINVERHFPMQVYVKDAQYVYRDLPDDVIPGDSPNEPFFINMLKKGDYCGISYTEIQYNRACKEHFNYLAWLLRRNKKMHN